MAPAPENSLASLGPKKKTGSGSRASLELSHEMAPKPGAGAQKGAKSSEKTQNQSLGAGSWFFFAENWERSRSFGSLGNRLPRLANNREFIFASLTNRNQILWKRELKNLKEKLTSGFQCYPFE